MVISLSKFIPLSVPNIGVHEKKLVLKALDDGWVSSVGPDIKKFEEEFAKYIGANHAIACANGTSALHISLIIAGVMPNDEVLIPNMTFIATANAVSYIGAKPIFIDVNKKTLGIDPKCLDNFIKKNTHIKENNLFNKISGKRIKAIIPVHMLGTPVDMDSINRICTKNNISIIEDAAEALGSKYKGKMIGSNSVLACFSFNGNKIMTTGGGGMIVTNSSDYAKRAKHISTTAKTDPVFFDHDEVGYNYRMVNILAALGIGQLKKMPKFLNKKKEVHALYREELKNCRDIKIFQPQKNYESNYWINLITFSNKILKKFTLLEIINHFSANGIQTRPIWTLLDSLPMYSDCYSDDLKISREIHKSSLLIPSSTNLSKKDAKKVIKIIKEIL